eukprot:1178500-Prorocentrum_minimum.AAC.5
MATTSNLDLDVEAWCKAVRQQELDKKNRPDNYEKKIPRPPLKRGEYKDHMPLHFYDRYRKRVRTEYWTCEYSNEKRNWVPLALVHTEHASGQDEQ